MKPGPNDTVVVINCPSKEAAEEFLNWLDGQGEQDINYWWEENREGKHAHFQYDYGSLSATLTEVD